MPHGQLIPRLDPAVSLPQPPAPCNIYFLFEAGHKLLHRLVTAQAADLKAERVIASNTSTHRDNLVERTEQGAPAGWEK